MAEFLHLDGYGAYVWPAYALALAVMVYFAVTSIARYRALKAELEALGGGRGRHRRASQSGPAGREGER